MMIALHRSTFFIIIVKIDIAIITNHTASIFLLCVVVGFLVKNR
jgi:hypothetical protein